ncbi:gamma-butyrobetaine hydroxylase-like domain-containing protein [Motiliproteus sp. SC1-56]|uniref:gamma-butyrobetaine hydroxylase-like domain-containing protein n=1 Tax=Motiliproteus sp. SC1-56 TaxID=2799565 RepID=UPI00351BF998
MSEAHPQKIALHLKSRELELVYPDGSYRLGAELLRVLSPSAEVRGHGVGNGVLQTGKRHVGLVAVEPSGRYALKLTFDDGHDSGLYNWHYLRDLCLNRERYWQDYLARLEAAGASRDPDGAGAD